MDGEWREIDEYERINTSEKERWEQEEEREYIEGQLEETKAALSFWKELALGLKDEFLQTKDFLLDMDEKLLAMQKELDELEEQLIAKDRRIAELELNTPALRYAVQTVEKLHLENQRLKAQQGERWKPLEDGVYKGQHKDSAIKVDKEWLTIYDPFFKETGQQEPEFCEDAIALEENIRLCQLVGVDE